MHVCVLNSPVHIAHAHTSIHIHAHLQTHTCIHTQRHTHRCRHRHRYRRRDKNRHRHRHRHRHRRGKGYGREGVDWCLVAHIIFHRYHRTCSMSRHSCHVAMKHVTLKRAYGILRRRATVWVEPVICHSYYMSQVLYVTGSTCHTPHSYLTSDMSHTSRLLYVTHPTHISLDSFIHDLTMTCSYVQPRIHTNAFARCTTH